MLDSLDADAIRRWCAAALAALRHHQREIDGLNVYPVPDSDTGTNLTLTWDAAQRALLAGQHLTDLADVLDCAARGALLGARGNSGVIVAQLLTGIAHTLGGLDGTTAPAGRALAQALRAAADAGYAAVAAPVEGTILTVARAAADAAEHCDSDNLAVVVTAAVAAADAALVRTPEQLAVLARAGVVDAGGQGLCVILHALAEIVTGVPAARGPLTTPQAAQQHTAGAGIVETKATAAKAAASQTAVDYGYEVQYLLTATNSDVTRLRGTLSQLGESLVIVGTGDGAWNVHVHVPIAKVGAAIEAGVDAGRPYQITVTPLKDAAPAADPTPPARSVAVFVEGTGLVELLRAEGALTSLDGITGQVIALGAPPTPWTGGDLRVIPLRSPVQALAALAVHDPTRPFDDDVIAMAEAAGACRYAEVTIATRAALTLAGPCNPGDVVALIDGEVNLIADDVVSASEMLLERMLSAGGELVTLLLGDNAPAELGSRLEEYLAKRWPFVEARTYPGGQDQPLLIGVE